MTAGIRYMLLSVLFFALTNIAVKAIPHIPVHEAVTFRALVTLLFGLCYLRLKHIRLRGKNQPLLIFRGAAGTVGLLCYFYTLQHMPLGTAVTVLHTSPIFTVLIATFLLRERARLVQWGFFALALGGVVLVKGFDPRVSLFELGVGISGAFFAAIAYTVVRKLGETDNPFVVVFYFPLVTLPLVGTYTLLHWVTPSATELALLLFIGAMTTAGQVYLTLAYQAAPPAQVSIFNYVGVLLAVVFGRVLFNEHLNWGALLGAGLIVASVVGNTLVSAHKRPVPEPAVRPGG